MWEGSGTLPSLRAHLPRLRVFLLLRELFHPSWILEGRNIGETRSACHKGCCGVVPMRRLPAGNISRTAGAPPRWALGSSRGAPPPRCLPNLDRNVSQVFKPCSDTRHMTDALRCPIRPWRPPVPARSVHIQNKDVFWPHAYRWRLSAAPRHDGTEEDVGKRLGEILSIMIILAELYLTVTLTTVLSPCWERGTFSPPTRGAGCLYLQTACGATRAANGNELAVITEVAALITVYLTTVLSQLTSSWGRGGEGRPGAVEP